MGLPSIPDGNKQYPDEGSFVAALRVGLQSELGATCDPKALDCRCFVDQSSIYRNNTAPFG